MLVACCVHQGISVDLCSENNCLVCQSEMKRKKYSPEIQNFVELEKCTTCKFQRRRDPLSVDCNKREKRIKL